MEKLNALWEFLSGKKTAIGGALLVAGNILRKFPQTLVLAEVVSEVGMYLAGFGLMHKGAKMAGLPAGRSNAETLAQTVASREAANLKSLEG